MLRVTQKILMNTDSQSVLIRKHLEIVKKKNKKNWKVYFFLSNHQPTNLRSSSA